MYISFKVCPGVPYGVAASGIRIINSYKLMEMQVSPDKGKQARADLRVLAGAQKTTSLF